MSSSLRVGFVAGVTLTRWRRTWAERYPQLRLDVVEVPQAEQRVALDQERVNLCFARLPLDPDGLHVVPLYTEIAVVVVSRDHPVSLYDSVTMADLAAEELLDADGPFDPFDQVAAGEGLLVVPHAVARSSSRRDLVFRPVTDAAATQVVLAWRRDREHPATQDFVGVVRGRSVTSSRGTPAAPPRSRRGRR